MPSFRPGARSRSLALPLLVFCLTLGFATPRATSAAPPATITAVGDIHGDLDDFLALLQHGGLIDQQHHWAAATATLVQTGDMLDRGPKPRDVMDFLISLQKEAGKKGGHVVVLLGNHEVMNIMGDLRYVTAENYASFADNHSKKRQHSAYEQYTKWRTAHRALLAAIPQEFTDSNEAEWTARHPLGFVEQREAFSPEGKYGKWLRELPAIAELDHVLFLHGGIDPTLDSWGPSQINARVHQEIAAFDRAKQFLVAQNLILPFFTLQETTAVVEAEVHSREMAPSGRHPTAGDNMPEHTQLELMKDFLQYGQWLSVASNGPLWFRGYDEWSDQQGAGLVPQLLAAYHATSIVVGHTPQKDGRIRSRFGGKIFLIDTGMLSSYYPQGRASALEIREGKDFTAEYMDQKLPAVQGNDP